MYLAFMNVHGAANEDVYTLQAPLATVKRYNTTELDTYKVAGAMITELDDGVGQVRRALETAGLIDNCVISFCSDNGGPLGE